jgi:hypothetical protein
VRPVLRYSRSENITTTRHPSLWAISPLIPGSTPVICVECDRTRKGRTGTDQHHFAGRANDPTTIPVPANDHVAELSKPTRPHSSAREKRHARASQDAPNGTPRLDACQFGALWADSPAVAGGK